MYVRALLSIWYIVISMVTRLRTCPGTPKANILFRETHAVIYLLKLLNDIADQFASMIVINLLVTLRITKLRSLIGLELGVILGRRSFTVEIPTELVDVYIPRKHKTFV